MKIEIASLDNVGGRLMITKITQRSHFECAYIMDVSGFTPLLNCHDYKIEATAFDPNQKSATIISFERFKRIIDECIPDHKFLLNSKHLELENSLSRKIQNAFSSTYNRDMYTVVDFDICAETLVNWLAKSIDSRLNDLGIRLLELKLRESNDSFSTWSYKD